MRNPVNRFRRPWSNPALPLPVAQIEPLERRALLSGTWVDLVTSIVDSHLVASLSGKDEDDHGGKDNSNSGSGGGSDKDDDGRGEGDDKADKKEKKEKKKKKPKGDDGDSGSGSNSGSGGGGEGQGTGNGNNGIGAGNGNGRGNGNGGRPVDAAPTGQISAGPVTAAGGATHAVTVTYTDDKKVRARTIGVDDIDVTAGPAAAA